MQTAAASTALALAVSIAIAASRLITSDAIAKLMAELRVVTSVAIAVFRLVTSVPRGCKKFCVNRHFAGNCNFQKWNKNDYTIIIT